MSALTEDLQRRLRAVLSLRVQAPLPADIPIEIAPVGGGENPHGDYDVRGESVPLELEIRTTAHPYAAWSYEEPGAWGKLLADLEAVGDPAPRSLTRQESDLLVKLNDQGGQRLGPESTYPQSVLAERDLIAPHGGHWYITPKGREVAAEIKAAAEPAKPSGTPPFTFVQVEQITPAAPTQWFAWDALGAKYYLRFRWGKGTVEAVYSNGSNYTVREFYHGGSSAITLEEFAQLADIDVSQIPEEQRR